MMAGGPVPAPALRLPCGLGCPVPEGLGKGGSEAATGQEGALPFQRLNGGGVKIKTPTYVEMQQKKKI